MPELLNTRSMIEFYGTFEMIIHRCMKLIHILLQMVNMLGQATWIQINLNSYICERVVINYQKGGD